jgi:hypothetical protein
VSEWEDVERSVLFEHRGAWRALFAQLHRNTEGNPEWFVFLYAVRSLLHDGGHSDGRRTHHQGRRAEPFLRKWQSGMNHWASRNCHDLKNSLSYYSGESARSPGWRPMSDLVLVAPSAPSRPALSWPVLRKLAPSPKLYRGSLSTS